MPKVIPVLKIKHSYMLNQPNLLTSAYLVGKEFTAH